MCEGGKALLSPRQTPGSGASHSGKKEGCAERLGKEGGGSVVLQGIDVARGFEADRRIMISSKMIKKRERNHSQCLRYS